MAVSRRSDDPQSRARIVAPDGGPINDGQDVVDHKIDQAGQQADIAQAADEQERASRHERAGSPSARFWETPSTRAGALFALLAGLLTVGTRIWPVGPPQANLSMDVPWTIATVLVGLVYLGGFFLADRYSKSARTLLIITAVVHTLIGMMSGAAVETEVGEGAFLAMLRANLFDVAPAVLALIAAFLIAPAPRRTAASAA